jgi:hypothetical protein
LKLFVTLTLKLQGVILHKPSVWVGISIDGEQRQSSCCIHSPWFHQPQSGIRLPVPLFFFFTKLYRSRRCGLEKSGIIWVVIYAYTRDNEWLKHMRAVYIENKTWIATKVSKTSRMGMQYCILLVLT